LVKKKRKGVYIFEENFKPIIDRIEAENNKIMFIF